MNPGGISQIRENNPSLLKPASNGADDTKILLSCSAFLIGRDRISHCPE